MNLYVGSALRRLWILLLVALLAATVTTAAAAAGVVNVASYGHDDGAIRQALTAAAAQGASLYFPAGTYTYDSTLTLNGLSAYGDGAGSVLVATSPSSSAIVLTGSYPSLRAVKVTSPNATQRLTNDESSGVLIRDASHFTVEDVTVSGEGSAGILTRDSTDGRIVRDVVANTEADGIHNTDGSSYINIGWNRVTGTGDDFISVVSYRSDGRRCHDINVYWNTVGWQPWGRGIAFVGGYNLYASSNNIQHTYGAGIYVASESAWSTYGIDHVVLNSNTIRYPAQGIHNANIRVSGSQPGYPITNVTGSANDVDPSKPAVRASGYISGISIGIVASQP